MRIVIHPVKTEISKAVGIIQKDETELGKEATRLYNQRCMLSNRLRIDQGDPVIIKENARLIDEIMSLEKMRKTLRIEEKEDKPGRPQVGPYVVFSPIGNFTREQLEEKTYLELNAIRDKLRFQIRHLNKKIGIAKSEDNRVALRKALQLKEAEIELLDGIRKQLKYASNS